MKKRGLAILVLFLLAGLTPAKAQLWSGIINATRAIDWSNVGIPGGIPTRNTICSTLTSSATSAQINAAIAGCTANQVVYLEAGTYTLTAGINFGAHDNVTLRGAGPMQTILNFTDGDACGGLGGDVCAINTSEYYFGSAAVAYGSGANTGNWTAGYTQGATQITLSAVTNLAIGMNIFLDQADDAADTSGVYNCQTYGPCANDVPGGAGRTGRGQLEIKHVTDIQGSGPYTVTISPGLYNTNWRTGQNPGAYWVGSMITGVGIEDMTLDHTGTDQDSINSGVYFFNAYQCWVKNIRSLHGLRNHVWAYQSLGIVVRDSYFYGSAAGAEKSYGFEGFGCADVLVENNIFEHMPATILVDVTTGLVASYNFDIDHIWIFTTVLAAGHWRHAIGTSMTLTEGNVSVGFTADDIHGTHNQETLFRNWISGTDVNSQTQQTVPIILYTLSRGYNIIGNVLGTAAYHNNYEDSYQNGTLTNPQTTIYVLGFCANVGSISMDPCAVNGTNQPNDALTQTTLMRWGNYDVVNATVKWDNAESSPGAVTYINAQTTPASHTLPSSFYLPAQPSFWATRWGTLPWPAIGPDVTGGTGPGGHAYAIPAQLCYNNTPKTGNITNFDATVCYGAAAPTTTMIGIWARPH